MRWTGRERRGAGRKGQAPPPSTLPSTLPMTFHSLVNSSLRSTARIDTQFTDELLSMNPQEEDSPVPDATKRITDTLTVKVDPVEEQMRRSRLLESTVSLSVPPISNYNEAERVRRCFQPGFCLGSLKKLPKKIQPGSLIQNKQDTILESRLRKDIRNRGNVLKSGFFNPLKYAYSDYDAAEQAAGNDREKNRLIVDSFGRKPFNVSNGRLHTRYEDMFLDCKDVLIDGTGPVKRIALDKYVRNESAEPPDPALRCRPSFHPPALRIDISNDVGRDRIQHWMGEIFSELSSAWPQLKFTVKFTQSDELIVGFIVGEDVNFASLGGLLLKYMNNLARSGLGSQFKLQRRGDRWNIFERESRDDGKIVGQLVFAFDAPWVKTNSNNVNKAVAAAERARAKLARQRAIRKKALESIF